MKRKCRFLRYGVLAVSLLLAGSVFAADTRALLSEYVRAFNAADEELYTNAVPNAAAEDFLLKNVPRFTCPDKDIERTYYFRWWTFRKHLRNDLGHWTITEFLPKVSWSGKGNTIVCPAGHHLREGRWLRDPRFVEDDARFWLTDPEATHRWLYSSWLFTGVCGIAAVSGRDELPVELLDAAVAYYRRWERGFVRSGWPTAKTAFMGGDEKGGFLSIDNYEGTEISLGGNGYKPLFTSAMWSEAASIAKVAKAVGRQDLAAEFSAKAEAVRQSLFAQCWNPACAFFTTCATNGQKGAARELHGYAPWYFGVPTEGRDPNWALLDDPQGFAAKFGLTFVERRTPGFALDYTGHTCKWNGPSWPFATSIALTALANDLHARPTSQTSRILFTSLLHQYAAQQSCVRPDGSTVPWIDESLNPDTGEWMTRKMLLARGGKPVERGKDYNHSTFCDLVIGGLVGIVLADDGGLTVDPLCPREWEFFRMDNLRFRGHDVEVVWRRSNGLSVIADGRVVARRPDLGRLFVKF